MRKMMVMRKNILNSSFILFFLAISLSLITLIPFTLFSIYILNAYPISQWDNRYKIPSSIFYYNYLLGFILITISLVLFMIGLIRLILTFFSKNQEKRNKVREIFLNTTKNKIMISSLIIIFIAFIVFLSSYLRFAIFNFYPYGPTDSYTPFGDGYLIDATAIHDFYDQGLIILLIFILMSILGIILLSLGIFSKRYIIENETPSPIQNQEEPQIQNDNRSIIEEMNKTRIKLLKSFSIAMGTVLVLSIIDLFIFNRFNEYYAHPVFDQAFISELARLIPLSGVFYFYFPGFIILIIILIFHTFGLRKFEKGFYKKNKNDEKIEKQIQNDTRMITINKKKRILISIFLLNLITFVILIIVLLMFIIFNGYILSSNFSISEPYIYFLISEAGFLYFYFPGVILFAIYLILNAIGMILLILNRIIIKR